MTVGAHLLEARKRIICCLIVWGVLFLGTVFFSGTLLRILSDRATEAGFGLMTVTPAAALICEVKLSAFISMMLSSPFILYQTLIYVLLPKEKEEKRKYIIRVFMFFVYIIIAMLICNYAMVPLFMRILAEAAKDMNLAAMLSVEEYLDFCIILFVSVMLCMMLPLLMIILYELGVISPVVIMKFRRPVYAGIFVLSAVLTPPDVFTMILFALPMILAYELGLTVVKSKELKKGSSRFVRKEQKCREEG